MMDDPAIWHYGLMAERWAEFLNDAPELPIFRQAIARFGQPVLDVACGAGRLLLPLLRAGMDIDGCDLSPATLVPSPHLAGSARGSAKIDLSSSTRAGGAGR